PRPARRRWPDHHVVVEIVLIVIGGVLTAHPRAFVRIERRFVEIARAAWLEARFDPGTPARNRRCGEVELVIVLIVTPARGRRRTEMQLAPRKSLCRQPPMRHGAERLENAAALVVVFFLVLLGLFLTA